MNSSLIRKTISLTLSLVMAVTLLLPGVAPRAYADTEDYLPTNLQPYDISYYEDYIYTAHRNSGTITRTSITTKTIETVVTGLGTVMAVALNSAGDLFYTLDSNARIFKIPAGSLTQLPFNASGISEYLTMNNASIYLTVLTFDEDDNLYVGTYNYGIFKIAAVTNSQTKVAEPFQYPIHGLAFSLAGDLFVLTDGHQLYMIAQHELSSGEEPAPQLLTGTIFSGRPHGLVIHPETGEILYSRYHQSDPGKIVYLDYEVPPIPPGIELLSDPIIAIDPARVNDTVSVVASVYALGTKPVASRGIEYRPFTDAGTEEWIQVPHTEATPQTRGSFTTILTGLEWQQQYELRGYASSDAGTTYTVIKPFVLDKDVTMTEPDLEFDRVGPSVVHIKDKKRVVAVGEGVFNLLRRPISEINFYLEHGSNNSITPLKYNIINNSQLELSWDADLEPGPYAVHLLHETYTDYVLVDDPDTEDIEGLLVVNTDFYKPRNFDRINVNGSSSENQGDNVYLQGPFTETPAAPGVYTLNPPSDGGEAEVVSINGSVMFIGSSLVVDKSGDDGHTIITGNGRLYVNSSVQDATQSYTLHEGPFTISSEDFVIPLTNTEPTDYLRLNMPIKANSLTFVAGGFKMTGQMELGFMAGNQKISGTIPLDDLYYRNKRFELIGTYTLNNSFKLGPVNASNIKFVIDSRFPFVSLTGKGALPNTSINFDMYMDLKQGRLDEVGFSMFKPTNLASTGLRVDYLYGGVEKLSTKTQIPQRFNIAGSVTDILVPQLKHPSVNHKFNIVGTDTINVSLTPYGFDATGIEYYYWLAVNKMNMQAVVSPSIAGIKGFSEPGFVVSGDINAFDVIKGTIGAYSFNKKGYSGAVKATVHVPKGIPRIGGATVRNVVLSVNEKQIIGMMKHNGINARVSYTFSNNTILFEVEAEPPKKSWWEKGLDFFNSINDFFEKIEPLGSLLEELLSVPTERMTTRIASTDLDFQLPDFKRSNEVSILSSNGRMQRIYDLTPISLSAQPELGANADTVARIVDGQLSSVDLTPLVSTSRDASSGGAVSAFQVGRAFEALIVMTGDQTTASLTAITADKPNAANAVQTDVVFDADSNKTFMRASLVKGEWKLVTDSDTVINVNELMFANPSLTLEQLAEVWTEAPERPVVALLVEEHGSYALSIDAGHGDAVVYKPDGRPYYLQNSSFQTGWNAFRNNDGIQHALLSAAEAGTWLIVADERPSAQFGRVPSQTVTEDLKLWVEAKEYPSVFKMTRTSNGQAVVEIYGADADTKLYMPNGEPYPLQPDSGIDGMNVFYDESQRKMTVWLDGVELEGQWKAVGSSFASVMVYKLNRKFKSIKPLLDEGRYSRYVELEGGDYMLSISGGGSDTVILDPSGKSYELSFADGTGNAYLQPASDRVPDSATGGDPLDQMQVVTPNPVNDGRDMLYVTLENAQAGKWLVQSNNRVNIEVQKLIPVTAVNASVAAVAGADNRIRVTWSTEHAAADTKVSIMLTDSNDAYIGEVIAEELSASGSKVFDIPSSTIPGTYYLSVMAASAAEVPAYAVAEGTVEVKGAYELAAPGQPVILSTGNGEVTLQFSSTAGQVDRYRVWIGEGGAGQPVTPYMDIDPQPAAVQETVISGLAVDADYVVAVSAIGQQGERLALSPLSEAVSLTLPAPQPAELGVEVNAGDEHPVAVRSFKAYDGSDEMLLITKAEQAELVVTSNQSARVSLIVDGETLVDSVQIPANGTHTFELNVLLGIAALKEREYNVRIEAVNENGDVSAENRRLVIDRTKPLLIASGGDDADGAPISLNGTVDSSGKILIVGQTEIGAAVHINDVNVPLDDEGNFVYYAPLAWEVDALRQEIIIRARDAAGNATLYGFEVIKDRVGSWTSYSSDLAALTTNGAVMIEPYQFGTVSYQAKADSSQVRIYAVPMEGTSVVTIDGQQLPSSGYIEIATPDVQRTVVIGVQSAGGEPAKQYMLQIGNGSSIALLSELTIKTESGDNIAAPRFTGTEETYEAYVDNETDAVTLTFVAHAAGSGLTVDGASVQNGQPSQLIALQAGETIIPVAVVSPDQSETRHYQVVIWREPSGDSELQQLGIVTAGAVLLQAFDTNVTEYNVLVPIDTATFALEPIAQQPDAAVRVNEQAVAGSPVMLPFNGESSSVVIEVQAQDDSTRQYRLNVLRQKAAPAAPPLLAELQAGAELDSDFAPYKFNYGTLRVMQSGKMNVTATAGDPQSNVTVRGESLQGGGTFDVELAAGQNTVIVTVESADLTSSQTYSIDVTRVIRNDDEPAGKERQSTVTGGSGDWNIQISIVRTRTKEGGSIDTVKLDENKARSILARAAEHSNNKVVRIHVTDLADDPADERMVNLSVNAMNLLAEAGISLQLVLPEAVIDLQAATLQQLGKQGRDAYFHVVPVIKKDDRDEVTSRVMKAELVLQAAEGQPVSVVGNPVKIDTNYAGYKTEILFPLTQSALPADKAQAEQMLSELAVYIEHSDGEKVLTRGELRYDAAGSLAGIAIEVNKFSTFTIVSVNGAAAVETLEPYLNGYPDGTFRPSQSIKRSEFATILHRLGLRAEELSNSASIYSDVAASYWAADAIASVQRAGLMLGDDKGLFRPEASVTRAEMASIVARLISADSTSQAQSAVPADVRGHWASEAIGKAMKAGILQGYPDGTFRPDQTLNRAEAVRVLNQLLERPTAKASFSTWPDVALNHWAILDIESASGTVTVLADGSVKVQPKGKN